jgi:hypothetical protein
MSGNPRSKSIVPETHEMIRQEDLDETLEHLADKTNTHLPQFGQEHIDWIRVALTERRELAAKQYHTDGRTDEAVTARLKELDGQINSVSPTILKILHFLSRVRAIIPALLELQQDVSDVDPNPEKQMIKEMKYQCSRAEVESAIKGLAELRIRPRILDQMARGEVPK